MKRYFSKHFQNWEVNSKRAKTLKLNFNAKNTDNFVSFILKTYRETVLASAVGHWQRWGLVGESKREKPRAQICKRFRSPGIDSKESIPPAYVAWRAGTWNRFVVYPLMYSVVVPARQAGYRFRLLKRFTNSGLVARLCRIVFFSYTNEIAPRKQMAVYSKWETKKCDSPGKVEGNTQCGSTCKVVGTTYNVVGNTIWQPMRGSSPHNVAPHTS